MATIPLSTIHTILPPLPPSLSLRRRPSNNLSSFQKLFRPSNKPLISTFTSNLVKPSAMDSISSTRVQSSGSSSVPDLGLIQRAIQLAQSSPPTWQSAIFSNFVIFLVGSPLLVSGLSLSGIAAAFLLGTLTWRGFGPSGFLLVATYFVIVSKTQNLICSTRSKCPSGNDVLMFSSRSNTFDGFFSFYLCRSDLPKSPIKHKHSTSRF